MDVALFIKNRLKQLRLGKRDLARATRMAELYISDLLAPNGLHRVTNRTDMHDQLERILKLPQGQLDTLVGLQRCEQAKKWGEQSSAVLHRRPGTALPQTQSGDVKHMQDFETSAPET
ncbi:MAG TPA: hypothetical protein VJ746_15895 [Nitrospira sp.]|nr:hypothetical protein [Nitrospira sp.]